MDALLQGFLDRAFELICNYGLINELPINCFPKNKEKKKEIQDKQKAAIKKATLRRQSVGGKISEMFGPSGFKELASTKLLTAKHAKFIAQLRHIITHNGGFVNIPFLKNCGVKNTTQDTRHWTCSSPLWDTDIWPDLGSFLDSYPPPQMKGKPQQANLDIIRVILPYIDNAVDFIQEVKAKLLTLQGRE